MNDRKIFWALVFGFIATLNVFWYMWGPSSGVIFNEKSKSPLEISLGSLTDARLYELKNSVLTDINFIPEGSIVSRFRNPDAHAEVSVVLPPNGLGNILLLENADGNAIVKDISSIKSDPSISSDGTKVAYSELNVPFGSTLYSDQVADWDVVVFDVESGQTKKLGVGFRPFFAPINSNVVIYSTPDGIVQYELSTDTAEFLVSDLPIIQTEHASYVSPNGKYLAFMNPITGGYGVFNIIGDFPYQINAVGEPAIKFELVALDNEYLYGVARNEATDERVLWKTSYEEINYQLPSHQIHTFELGQLPYQIIP